MVCRAMRGGRNINFTFNRRVKSPVFYGVENVYSSVVSVLSLTIISITYL